MNDHLLALHRRKFSSLRKHRSYRPFFVGHLVSLARTCTHIVALPVFVVELTHSPHALGRLAFCRFAPLLL